MADPKTHRTLIVLAALILLAVHVHYTAQWLRESKGSSLPRAPAAGVAHHELTVTIDPGNHTLTATDRISIPMEGEDGSARLSFVLHENLSPTSPTPGVALEKDPFGTRAVPSPLTAYRASSPASRSTFTLQYAGTIHHPIEEYGEDYGKRLAWSRGLIAEEGVCPTGGSGWYPRFPDHLNTFTLDVTLPRGWTAVSQGGRELSPAKDSPTVRWTSTEPQDEIVLLAAPFHQYVRGTAAGPLVMVFLRAEEPDLAERYLQATDRYIRMYSSLIGPYPYAKFALVENFWETGYGLPSLTLLGPKVLRLPFILHSSYPHEILHNWWGNGVFVEYERGNWSEGLTAYLSDHLIQEQQHKGAEHRQTSLQKYADYVSEDRDFPLVEFRSRHGSASEAVGYTKMMMFVHMLRVELGDRVFVEALRSFYRNNLYRYATFQDLQTAFERVSGRGLGALFEQWTRRTGAPSLKIVSASAAGAGGEFSVSLLPEQEQGGEPYRLLVPVAVSMEGRERALQKTVALTGRRLEVAFPLPARPRRLDVDPEFDVMRRLDRREFPPALSLVFGAPEVTVVLPAHAPEEMLGQYRRLADEWRRSSRGRLTVRLDEDLDDLPPDRSVWLLGWENRFLPTVHMGLAAYSARIDRGGVRLPGLELAREGNGAAVALRHPENPELGLACFVADLPGAVPGIGRRLPHFHKYSYLAFEGETAENTLKGRWPVVDSPLTVLFEEPGDTPVGMSPLAPRIPLAEP